MNLETGVVPKQYYLNKIIEESLILLRNETQISVSPMSDGYCVITDVDCYEENELVELMSASLFNDRTVVCMQLTETMLNAVSNLSLLLTKQFQLIVVNGDSAVFLDDLDGEIIDENTVLFIMSESAIDKQLELKTKSALNSFVMQETMGEEYQKVQFIGVGTNLDMLTEQAKRWIEDSDDIILFERTYENVVRHLKRKGNIYVLPYIYEDFDRNIMLVDGQLAVLDRLGIKNVTVLIEGNPQIYDVPNKLSSNQRNFHYEVFLPIGIAISHYLEEKYHTGFMNPSHVYFTGFNERHGKTKEALVAEIEDYMKTDTTCVIVEMYAGSIELVLSAIRRADIEKSIFVVSNAFTPTQSIYFLPSSCKNDSSILDAVKGELTTLVILDDRRFYSKSPTYRKAKREYGFENYANIYEEKM